jgi:uncharacterized membrane protein
MSEASAGAPGNAELRTILLIAYGLFVLAIFNGASAIAGVVLVYVKRDEARGTQWQSHFQNLIAVFWISFVVALVALALVLQAFGGLAFSLFATNGNPPPELIGWLVALVPLFYVGGIAFLIWYLYRTLRGLMRALDYRPY